MLLHVGTLDGICKYRVRPVCELLNVAVMHLVSLSDDKGELLGSPESVVASGCCRRQCDVVLMSHTQLSYSHIRHNRPLQVYL